MIRQKKFIKRSLIFIFVLLVIGLAGYLILSKFSIFLQKKIRLNDSENTVSFLFAADEQNIRALIEDFGSKIHNVFLQAPPDAVKKSIQDNYSNFISEKLLSKWLQNPSLAPGRTVSSPWPDKIEISHFFLLGENSYAVDGYVVYLTSQEIIAGGFATKQKVNIVVKKHNKKWMIIDLFFE